MFTGRKRNLDQPDNVVRNTLIFVAALLFAWYGVALNWSIPEAVRFFAGVTILWGPIAALLYFILDEAIGDPMVRLAFSSIGSYTLTTLLYFAAAVSQVRWLFAAALVGAGAMAVWLGARRGITRIVLPRLDPILLVIVAASLVTTIPYSNLLTTEPSGKRILRGYVDQLYHVGLEYELSRHVPPLQNMIRGGTPERAYHMFPHLTVALLAKFTRQNEMLRAHSVYHYGAITVLICLAMYGIGFLLTATKTGGYVCAFLPFLSAIAGPQLMPNTLGYFYFTIWPHASSSVVPSLFTDPQAYSGIAVLYGILLGIAALIRRPMGGTLVCACALMVAALLRFRIQFWLAATPVFLVFVLVNWYRTRRPVWILAAAIVAVGSGLLYAEMLLPVYLRGTAKIHFGLTGVTRNIFYTVWPFASFVRHILRASLPGPWFAAAWQFACIIGFAAWDMLGIPLLVALVFGLGIMKRADTQSYYWFTAGMMGISMLLAMYLNAGYDSYSVSGQLLLHFGWYVLPIGGVCLAWLLSRLMRNRRYHPLPGVAIVLLCGSASAISQRLVFPRVRAQRVITSSSWDALQYLKEQTPTNAIVLSTSPLDRRAIMVPGLAARAGFYDYVHNPVDIQLARLNPKDNRPQALRDLEAAPDPAAYCSVLRRTPISHILEEPSNLLMPNLPCLRRLWTGRDGVTSVWQVVRP